MLKQRAASLITLFMLILTSMGAYAATKAGKKMTMQKETTILGGGCFWGVQDLIRKLPGVLHSEVGYAGGTFKNPTYEDMKTGKTGHAEVVKIEFDPAKIKFDEILDFFFRLHDPTTLNRQQNDVGTQYRSIILFMSDAQKAAAEKKIKEVDASKKWKNPVVTEVTKFTEYYPAEAYHQDYLVKNPHGYTCHFLRK